MIHRMHEAMAQATVTPDEAHGRVYSWLPGVVTDVDTNLMQIKARLGKQADNESTDWISQMGMGGMESLPEVGDPVGVVFLDGDVHRGAYFCFPQSNSKGRPTEAMILGTTSIGLINNLADQLQQLKTTVNNFISVTFPAHVHPYVYGNTAVTPSVGSTDSDPAPAKGLAADGSVVSSVTTNKKALSKRGRIR